MGLVRTLSIPDLARDADKPMCYAVANTKMLLEINVPIRCAVAIHLK